MAEESREQEVQNQAQFLRLRTLDSNIKPNDCEYAAQEQAS